MFQPRKVEARDIMQDDNLKMGGQMYRVANAQPNMAGDTIIHVYPFDKRRNPQMISIILDSDTRMKIYNQIPE